MTAKERLDYLLETVFAPTNTEVTIGHIRDNIGLTQAEYGLVRSTLDSAIAALKVSSDPAQRFQGIELQDALSAMLGDGISLSNPDRQATIDLLAKFGKWPDEIRDKVKAVGGTMMPRWQTLAIVEEPTLESVQAEMDAATAAEEARQAREPIAAIWAAKQAVISEGIFDGTITTVDQIIAAVSE